MKELIPNENFQKNTTPLFVKILNEHCGVKANVTEKGFEYDYESFVNYAKNTSYAKMPMILLNFDSANLKWLLGDKLNEVREYKRMKIGA